MQNVLIGCCMFCGAQNCIAHSKYIDRCEKCGKRYSKYANYKSRQKAAYSNARQRSLEDTIEEYRALQRQGYKVPKDLENNY